MALLYKTYDVAAGKVEFKFTFANTLAAIDDFDILKLSPLQEGYDNNENTEIAVFPSNIDITIDDFTGDNYNNVKTLMESYTQNYPFNWKYLFSLEMKLNDEPYFTGFLDELQSNKNERELVLKFVDGVNKLKDVNIGNPYFLRYLSDAGVIKRTSVSLYGQVVGEGYGLKVYLHDYGVRVTDIENQDKDTRLQAVIEKLFRSILTNANINFQNDYLFGDSDTLIADMVTIDNVNVRRVSSNILGRYVVVPKGHGNIFESGSEEYTKFEHFKVIYEDEQWITYYHDWSGNFPTDINIKKWEKGVQGKNAVDVLKIIARNLFSYFGILANGDIFFRHRRFLSNPTELNSEQIEKMSKVLTVDKVHGVKIDDFYTNTYGSDGTIYESTTSKVINYKIPLNAFPTANAFEYRLNYFVGSTEKRVINFYDKQISFKDIPQEVISRAEWLAFKDFRDKYEIELIGVNYKFDSTYSVNFENYKGKFRPIMMEKDLEQNSTKLTALQIE